MFKNLIFTAVFICSTAVFADETFAVEALTIKDQRQSLLDTYQQALSHDATLASALSANQSAQELIEQGKALYLPNVNFSAGVNATQADVRYLNSGPSPFGFAGNTNYEGYNYGINATQPIFRKQNLVQIDRVDWMSSVFFAYVGVEGQLWNRHSVTRADRKMIFLLADKGRLSVLR